MAKSKQKKPLLKLRVNIVPFILSLILFILIVLAYILFITDKYYPRTFVGDTGISFLTQGQAIRKLEGKFNQRTGQKLQFNSVFGTFTVDLATSSASLDYTSLDQVFKDSHSGSRANRFQKQLASLFSTSQIFPKVTFGLLDRQTDPIAQAINKPAVDATLTFDEIPTPTGSTSTTLSATPSARIQIKEGIDGLALDEQQLESALSQFILTGKYSFYLPLKLAPPKITTAHVLKAGAALEDSLTNPLKLQYNEGAWTIEAKQLLTLLDLKQGTSLLDKEKVSHYLAKIASEIDQEVQEGLFDFNPATKRVTAFRPSQEGRKLDQDKTYELITRALESNSKTINLPVSVIKPRIQTADVNSLGIVELLGRGISNFAGSIQNRIYNINLTAQKINGILLPPGEIFSFNQAVGDISAATGFKQAYVIKGGRTVLDDGGGVCQDSTTLFRAVLNAGLPVIRRTAHAYRVSYYEQGFPPGLDATVFYPSVDFQFKNDTTRHILIQTYTAGTTLYVDLYGTSDGRTVTLTKPVVTNQTPPPPELRQDDPTLPKGTVKQVDWSAWGAAVTFSRTVAREGETLIQETFKSNYKPWQAVYLVGTQ